MTRRVTRSRVFGAHADKLLSVLTDANFIEAQHRLDPAVIGVTVDIRSPAPAVRSIRVHTREYARSFWGIDRSKRRQTECSYEWDMQQRCCCWALSRPGNDRFVAEGNDRVELRGEHSLLITEFRLQVLVPVVGPAIERLVMAEVDRRQEAFAELVSSYCAAAPPSPTPHSKFG